MAPLVNWAGARTNKLTRPLLEKVAGIHRHAALAKYHRRTFMMRSKSFTPPVNRAAPAYGRNPIKVGTPVARQALKNAKPFLSSECPLAGMHIAQEMEMLAQDRSVPIPERALHPVELMARAYSIPGEWSNTIARVP